MPAASRSAAQPQPDGPVIGRSLRWSFGLGTASVGLQFLLAAMLARFLVPGDYGLVAAAAGVMRLLQYLSDLGIAQTATQKADFDRTRDAPVLFAAVLAANAAAVALVWLLAPAFAGLAGLGTEGMAILRLLSLALVANAAAQAGLGLLRREFDFRTIGLIGLVAQALGQGLVALPLAVAGFGAWSLVAGTLVQSALAAALVLARVRHPLWPRRFEPARLRALAARASGFSVLRLLDSAGLHTLPLVVLVLGGSAAAGLWDRALVLTLIPLEMLYGTLGQVLFPAFSRLGRDEERLRRSWLALLLLVPCLVAAIAAGMAAAAGPLVALALGPAWSGAVGPVFWLALWATARGVVQLCGALLEGTGHLFQRGAVQAGYLVLLFSALAAVRPDGATAAARLLLAVDAIALVPLLLVAARSCGASLGQALARLALALLPAPLVALAVHGTLAALAPAAVPPVLQLLAAVAAGALALALALAFHPSRELRQVIVRRVLGDTLAMDLARGGVAARLARFMVR